MIDQIRSDHPDVPTNGYYPHGRVYMLMAGSQDSWVYGPSAPDTNEYNYVEYMEPNRWIYLQEYICNQPMLHITYIDTEQASTSTLPGTFSDIPYQQIYGNVVGLLSGTRSSENTCCNSLTD